jgi:hypothetical protein
MLAIGTAHASVFASLVFDDKVTQGRGRTVLGAVGIWMMPRDRINERFGEPFHERALTSLECANCPPGAIRAAMIRAHIDADHLRYSLEVQVCVKSRFGSTSLKSSGPSAQLRPFAHAAILSKRRASSRVNTLTRKIRSFCSSVNFLSSALRKIYSLRDRKCFPRWGDDSDYGRPAKLVFRQ